MTDKRASVAAKNNADLYEAIFSAHGLAYRRHDFAFEALGQTPPYYSDITIQEPGRVSDLMPIIDRAIQRTGGRVGIKDSYCELDCAALGLSVLFEAEWIWRAPLHPAMDSGWSRLTTPQALTRFEQAWSENGSPATQRVFPPAMLDRPDFAFFARASGGGIDAGCIANLSNTCIGLSNVFSQDGSAATFAQAADVVAQLAPDLPVVGYESGDSLAAARKCGFDACGTLRILVPQA